MPLISESLVHQLIDGPIDIVGDVHGEIDALRSLLRHLGYEENGRHPSGRRLVFAGDLTDRGPDSPAVVKLVRELVDADLAQCVLGNHELNILLGDRKHDNHWFFGETWALDGSDEPTPAELADDQIRASILSFFNQLPLVLERKGIRVVHACWHGEMVGKARQATSVIDLFNNNKQRIDREHGSSMGLDEIDRGLNHQNCNPAKVLTSGLERRVPVPFEASGKLRFEERVPWWESYADKKLCVFGHYSLYRGRHVSATKAICVDFAVAKRWAERKKPDFDGIYKGLLGCLRLPENVFVFDNGETETLDVSG